MNFLILCPPRTGSTLLCSSLNEHSSLLVEHEILHRDYPSMVKWRKRVMKDVYGEIRPLDSDLTLFFDKAFDLVNGYKILFDQIASGSSNWQYFLNKKGLKIIFLHRDWVEIGVSHYIALKRGIWQLELGEKRKEIKPFEMNLSWLRDFLSKKMSFQSYLKKLFPNHLHLDYQKMVDDWDNEIYKTLDFLEIKREKLPMTYGKLLPPIEDLLLNYEDVRRTYALLCSFRKSKGLS